MKRYTIIISILLIVFPILAKNAKTRPAWVDDPKSMYNDSKYLSAVGCASTRAAAESNAAANLAKIFRSEITTSTSYQERYNELMTDTKISSSTETQSSKNIQVKANQNLYNIEIGKVWNDKKKGQIYTIAYLDRIKTAEIYKDKINENSKQIRYYIQQAMISSNTWKVYACYNVAGVIHQKTEELLSQLAVISLDTRESIELGYDANEFRNSMANWAKAIQFAVEVDGETGNENKVQSAISEIITSNGWSISDVNAALIETHIYMDDVELNQPQKFVRCSYSLSIYGLNGSLIFNLSDDTREGHINKEEAKARALRSMINKIKTSLPNRLNQYFDSLVIVKK